jgi:hypothetical protein
MKKTSPIIPLFKKFIKETETGKRLKKNGEKIKASSITNYHYVLQNLIRFSIDTSFDLRLCDAAKLDKRELQSEKKLLEKILSKVYRIFIQK